MAQQLKIDIVAKDKSKQALTGVRGGLDRLKKSVFSVQNAFIGLGAGLAIRSLVNTGKQIEGLQVRLKFLFGTASEGAKAFDEMAKFAAKVPFSLEEIQAGSGVLAVVSKDAKELANLMEITGNVAAVTGLDFKTTAEQIQRSMSAGISAADLFRDRGVKSMLGFKAGAVVSVEETAAAFTKIFGKGGKFGGATDELAKTFEGTLSMIGDKFFNFKRTILEAGFFEGLKKQFGDLNKTLGENSDALDRIAVTIGTVLASAVESVADGLKFINKYSEEFKTAFQVIIGYKIGAMFLRWAAALRTVYIALAGVVGLSGVGLVAVAASAVAATAAYVSLGKVMDSVGAKADKNFEKFKTGEITDRGRGMAQYTTISPKEMEAVDTFLYNYVNELEYAIPTATQKAIAKFKEMNDGVLQDMKLTMEDIRIIAIEGIHDAVKKISRSLAEAVVYGKSLMESFKSMAQGVMAKIIAHLIEQVALMAIQKFFKLEELDNEAKKDNLIRKQNTNLKRQIVYQSILAALGGGGSFLSTSGGSMARASGGSVSKGQPYMVGEQGAELFIPNQSGQIQQTARGGSGGGSTTVNFNINTVDARGFDELLTQSRGTITQLINQAVNERGGKSII
jgi:hypothetical protein